MLFKISRRTGLATSQSHHPYPNRQVRKIFWSVRPATFSRLSYGLRVLAARCQRSVVARLPGWSSIVEPVRGLEAPPRTQTVVADIFGRYHDSAILVGCFRDSNR